VIFIESSAEHNNLNKMEEEFPAEFSSIDGSSSQANNGYCDFVYMKTLGDSHFPVISVYSPSMQKQFAVKVFLYENNRVSNSYLNEARFMDLTHPNIISIRRNVDDATILSNEQSPSTSFLVMDLARCDFVELIQSNDLVKDEKLVRTYFHQLVEGVEYLHSEGIAHLDLKPENLLLGEDFQLKIADFDFAFRKGDASIRGNGTANYRAPELISKNCQDPTQADIYSMGIILFTMMFGIYPYLEESRTKGYDMFGLLLVDSDAFWMALKQLGQIRKYINPEFKDLFVSMIKREPDQRVSLADIKETAWYQEPIYTESELATIMKGIKTWEPLA
jgi:serine/threonine protein kinase